MPRLALDRLLPPDTRRRHIALRLARPAVPRDIARNFRPLDARGRAALEAALQEDFADRFPAGYAATPDGRRDLEEHLDGRIAQVRAEIVPWLADARELRGAKLLEIGSGSGSATVAFAEQGAHVTALDVDERWLRVARIRCDAYGIPGVTFVAENASALGRTFERSSFDFVVFFASVEHMTYEERLTAIEASWQLLRSGGFWSIVDSPNRLWYYDSHTSDLPFFHWLPDELAMRYVHLSPRQSTRDIFAKPARDPHRRLIRAGRGMSYHELQLALPAFWPLQVVSSLSAYRRRRSLLRRAHWLIAERRFEAMLAKASPPGVPSAFFGPYLNVVIQKDGPSASAAAENEDEQSTGRR